MTGGSSSAGGPASDDAVSVRHPTEDDQPPIVEMIDEWFSGQRVRHLIGRAWFRHFGSTSWLAEDAAEAPIGFLIGYRSPDRPAEAVIHLIGVHPNHRRRGIGRALIDAFVGDGADRGIALITALAWPGEPPAIAFFRALAFVPDDGPGSRNLFGTSAFPDYDGPGEDRIVFVRRTLERFAGAPDQRRVSD
jgi:ribosomal protein S18 acetylase RimI-like enzyme